MANKNNYFFYLFAVYGKIIFERVHKVMKKTTSIIFTGDIGFDHYMEGRFEDENLLSQDVKKFLQSADHICVNVEGALSDKVKTVNKNGVAALTHSMSPKVGDFLEGIGADIWNLCNNHIMDAGPEGLFDTLELAKEKHADTIGVGKNLSEAMEPLILEEAGGIGIFSVGYQRACRKASEDTPGCFSWSDLENIKKIIEKIKRKCRYCIVVAHAGEEFTCLPNPYTRDRYIEFLNMGADFVVAHHPHVPMNYEKVGDKYIFYSLGNFIFDTDYQRSQYNTEKGVLLKLNLSADSFSFEALGLRINREKETVEKAELPLIFTDVEKEEYEKLAPFSAKAFINATKKQQIYLKPDKYNENTTEEEWHENFYEPLRSGRVPGETLDFQILVPFSESIDYNKWHESKLEDVKAYISEQL